MEIKQPLSFEEQLNQLKLHGLKISNDEYALDYLKRINYYRFTGYCLEFRKSQSDSNFIDDTTFESIRKIYDFDTELRNCLSNYLHHVEIYFRTQISNIFSIRRCSRSPHDQHYDFANYYYQDRVRDIFRSIEREVAYHNDSPVVQHHRNIYGNKMPLWVLVELISFSNLSKYYNSLFIGDQKAICNSVEINHQYLSNWLHCMSVLRNKCAHGNRIYNTSFSPPASLSIGYLRANPQMSNDSLFAYMYVLERMLPTEVLKLEYKLDIDEIFDFYKTNVDLRKIGKFD